MVYSVLLLALASRAPDGASNGEVRAECTSAPDEVRDALAWLEASSEQRELGEARAVRRGLVLAQRSLRGVSPSDPGVSYAHALLVGSALAHLDEALARLDEEKGLESVGPLILHARASVTVLSEMTCSPLFFAEQGLAALGQAIERGEPTEAHRRRALDAFQALAADASLSDSARDEALSLHGRLEAVSMTADDASLALERVRFATQGLCVGVASERVLGIERPGVEHPLAHALGQLYEVEATAEGGDEVHTGAGLRRAEHILLDAAHESRGPRAEALRALAKECRALRESPDPAARSRGVRDLRTSTEALLFDVGD